MGVNLSGRSFLRLLDFSTEEIEYLLQLSKNFKDLKRTGTPHKYLEGQEHRPALPEDLHAHPLLLRGRRHGPGHGCDLPRPRLVPDG